MSLGLVLLMAVAGGCGALARYGVAEWMARHFQRRFPIATFCINITGACALGVLMTAGGVHTSGLAPLRAVLGTGFLGGYTTFSALSFETHALAQSGYTGHAWVNGLATLLCGLGALVLGIWVGTLA